MDLSILLFQLFVFLFSVIIHEVSHGIVALRLGDTTARDMGRLTLNPVPHLDLFGSFLVPLFLYFSSGGSFIFGWAKPVPYNPYNLKNPALGGGLIALAGPVANILVALIFGIIIRFVGPMLMATSFASVVLLFHIIVFINVLLAIFNLVPIPPLDGSKVLFAFLPPQLNNVRDFLNRFGFPLLLLFIFFGFRFITPIMIGVYKLFVGSGVGLF